MMGALTSWFSSEVVLGLLRNALLSGGVTTLAAGYFTGTQWGDLVGAIITIASIILSAISNRNKATATAVVKAVEAHPNVTVIPASETATGKPKVVVDTNAYAGPQSGLSTR